ncbi:MAG: hypothetical protein COT73_05505 [Bdellovibrio sp. CG10_big_fil_rev_8_21_14_0_10_47_8]|nr:MAG: hypothetical protein COT73_05505 [Bdellovibrio sp. CG10_big_fil_rev_8_21_14_0_10_47_8]
MKKTLYVSAAVACSLSLAIACAPRGENGAKTNDRSTLHDTIDKKTLEVGNQDRATIRLSGKDAEGMNIPQEISVVCHEDIQSALLDPAGIAMTSGSHIGFNQAISEEQRALPSKQQPKPSVIFDCLKPKTEAATSNEVDSSGIPDSVDGSDPKTKDADKDKKTTAKKEALVYDEQTYFEMGATDVALMKIGKDITVAFQPIDKNSAPVSTQVYCVKELTTPLINETAGIQVLKGSTLVLKHLVTAAPSPAQTQPPVEQKAQEDAQPEKQKSAADQTSTKTTSSPEAAVDTAKDNKQEVAAQQKTAQQAEQIQEQKVIVITCQP